MNLKRDTYAIVDLDHLKYNVELAHSEFKRPLMAVIKADAYGHGYKEVASFLKDIDYIEMFAVATLQEAIELRELGINKGILILGAIPTSKEDIDLAIKYDISLTMVSVAYLKLLDHLIDKGQTLKVHIKLDTGMHRIGLMSKEELSTLLKLVDPDKFNVEGIFTHFATADGDDEAYEKQRSLFYEMIGNCKFKYIHCCNSAAMTYHHDEKSNMGRLGITMYGPGARPLPRNPFHQHAHHRRQRRARRHRARLLHRRGPRPCPRAQGRVRPVHRALRGIHPAQAPRPRRPAPRPVIPRHHAADSRNQQPGHRHLQRQGRHFLPERHRPP